MKDRSPWSRSRLLPFDRRDRDRARARVGCVHRDGSITFRGRTYGTLKELPADCLALRLDLDTHRQWIELYGAIAPETRRQRVRPRWTRER